MRSRAVRYVVVAVVAVWACSGLVLDSSQTGVKRPVPSSNDPAQKASKPLVGRDQLVGKYYFGDGLGVNCSLELSADGRFKFRWTGCLGEYDKNVGTWAQRGDLVQLEPELENKHEGFEGVNVRFVPMVWNKHVYLVDEYEAPGFCSALRPGKPVAGLDEMHGQEFVKRDEKGPLKIDSPNLVPERFRRFVGAQPVSCRIVRINRDGTVTIDRGSTEGLRAGLMLTPREWSTGDLEILSVTASEAVCRPGYFFNTERVVKVGDEFGTGGEYFQPRGTGWARLPELPAKEEQPSARH